MHPILYTTPNCPYCLRAKATLTYAHIDVQLRSIDLDQLPKELSQIKANASVPFLVFEDGTFIDESWDICKWALNQNDPDHWLGENRDLLLDCEMLIEINDHSFAECLRDLSDNKNDSEAQQECQEIVLELEEQLEDHQFLISDSLSAADIAIAPFIQQFSDRYPNLFSATQNSKLLIWLQFITQLPHYPNNH